MRIRQIGGFHQVRESIPNLRPISGLLTAIFMPMSFLMGVFGMNFTKMPEVADPTSFYILCGVWAIMGIGMLGYFWRKG